MNVLEKDIEDLIWNTIQGGGISLLKERGLYFIKEGSLFKRQVQLGSYGVADIIQIDVVNRNSYRNSSINITIIELKKEEIGFLAMGQAARYRAGILRIIEELLDSDLTNTVIDIHIVLIGKSIDQKGDFPYFIDTDSNYSFFTMGIDIVKGVFFKKQSGFHMARENFNTITEKDIYSVKKYIRGMIRKSDDSLFDFDDIFSSN